MSLHVILKRSLSLVLIYSIILSICLVSLLLLKNNKVSAQSNNWDPGRIIDDAVFANSGSMNASQIQQFLNSKVPTCDTWHTAGYGQNPPFTCLKDFSENGRSAAQIIYDVSLQYQINPQVLLVLLQKEQGLITDTWPLAVQYRSATGYGCPDTAPCDAQYYGLTNQVTWAAKMFRSILNASPNWYTPYKVGNNYIRYSPDISCGGATVNIQNRATQALYNYTPYQPNSAALAAGWGTGTCGAYGNRNFSLYFKSWFGNTLGPDYSAQLQSVEVYTNPELTNKVPSNNGTYVVAPHQDLFIHLQLLNNGRSSWDNNTNLGTSSPSDRTSLFYSDSWLASTRVAKAAPGSIIKPNEVSTLTIKLKTPGSLQLFTESFSLVQEDVSWLGQNIPIKFQVSETSTDELPQNKSYLTAGEKLTIGQSLLSADRYNCLRLNEQGSAEMYKDFIKIWSTPQAGKNAELVMQQDGNLVLYNASGTAIWDSGTSGNDNAGLHLQTDGNLVVYREDWQYIWQSNTSTNISHQLYPTSELYSGGVIFRGQAVESFDRKHALHFQGDGNLVLYDTSTHQPLWNTGTFNTSAMSVAMQLDGNLVVYDAAGKALWDSKTSGRGLSKLAMQNDGNLVMYNTTQIYSWASNTTR